MKATVLAEPALVGREKELEELVRSLESAVEGRGSTVLVSGEAGSGKTRLVNEFLGTLKEKDVAVLAGYCLSNVAIPYFPFIEAFDSFFSAKNCEGKLFAPIAHGKLSEQLKNEELDLKVWLRGPTQDEKTRHSESLSPENWKNMTFAAVTNALKAISKIEPLILFLEDVHWADSASLSLFHYISRAIRSSRVLILATFRSEELDPDEEGHPHPLIDVMRLMYREFLFVEIKLASLNLSEVAAIGEKMVGGNLNSEFAEKLYQESYGNPLFVVESMRMLFENHNLTEEDGRWCLSLDELNVPKRIKDVILRRVGLLEPFQRRLLDLASVVGDKFDVELLSTVLGVESLKVLEALNNVAQSSCLVCCDGNLFRFDHAKSRETIFGELSTPLKRGYHAKIAEKLEAKGRSTGQMLFGDLAYHYAQAGNNAKAVEYSLTAGEDALARFSNAEAIKHFNYVLQNASKSKEDAEKKRTAREGLGDAYYVIGNFTKASQAFEQLANSSTGKVKLRAFRKAMDAVFFGPHDVEHLLDLAKQAQPYAAYDRLENARIRFHKAGNLNNLSRKKALRQIGEFEAALQVFEEEYSLPDVARALEACAVLESAVYFEEKGLSNALLSIAIFEELNDTRSLVRASQFAGSNFGVFGLMKEERNVHAKVIEIGEKIGDYYIMGMMSLNLGTHWDIYQGSSEEALSYTLKALEYFDKTDTTRQHDLVYADLLRQYAKLGNMKLAEEYHSKLIELLSIRCPNPDPNSLRSLRPRSLRQVAMSLAVFSAAKGCWKDANRYFEEAFKAYKDLGARLFEIGVKADYAWALERQGRTEEANAQRLEVGRFLNEVNERFSHVKLDARLFTPRTVAAGEEFEMRLHLVNLSRKQGLVVKVEGFVLQESQVTSPPANCFLKGNCVELKNRSIGSFHVETIKLKLKASQPGDYALNPEVTYIDEMNQTQICKSNAITITVQPAKPKYEVLPGRIRTGCEELDALLFGGIPEKYAVALTAPAIDEKDLLIRRFLEAGAKEDQPTFSVTTEPENVKTLAKVYQENFFLFVCNLQADTMVESQTNIFKLKGVENLTEIDIALTKTFRTIDSSAIRIKRICIDIISDALLQHHAINTRRWLSALLPTLKTKGFTVLATLNPKMHPQEEIEAILSLFDGEIRVTEKETPEGTKQTLRVRKLLNQKYLDKEIVLTKEKLS